MAKGDRKSLEELLRSARERQTASPGRSEIPIPRKRHDTALFLGITAMLAVPFVYVLQSNGVAEVPWLVSALMYLAIIIFASVAYFKWTTSGLWKPSRRIATFLLGCGALSTLSGYGTYKEYAKEHARSVSMQAYVAPTYKPGHVVNGITWSAEYRHVQLSVADIDQFPVEDLDVTVNTTEKGDLIAQMAQDGNEISGCKFHAAPLPDIVGVLNGVAGDHAEIHSNDGFKGISFPGPWWEVHCPTLSRGTVLDLMIATINKSRTAPRKFRLTGSYQVAGAYRYFDKLVSVRWAP